MIEIPGCGTPLALSKGQNDGRDPARSDTEASRGWLASVGAETWWLASFFLALAVVVTVLVVGYETTPGRVRPWPIDDPSFDKRYFESLMCALGVVGLLGLFAWGWLRRFQLTRTTWMRRSLTALLAGLVFVAGLNFFYARRSAKQNWLQIHDTYHYALGAKYYAELDYFGLYECTAQAMDERGIAMRGRARDLRTYHMHSAKRLLSKNARERCRGRFSKQRWTQFQKDLDVYIALNPGGGQLRYALRDQGYNGTPTQAFFASALANSFEWTYRNLVLAALIDIYGLCLALFVVGRAFGARQGLVVALLLFTLAVDRFGVMGASFVRYWWLISLLMGAAALKKRRHAAAGAWLTTSVMFNVFPLVFFVGASIPLLSAAVKERRITRRLRAFVLGAAVAGAGLGIVGVSHGSGIENYELFAADMEVHGRGPWDKKLKTHLEKNPMYGVGSRFVFFYRGRHNDSYKGYKSRRLTQEYRQIAWLHDRLALLFIAIVAAICVRLDPVEACGWFGFCVFFCLLPTTGYYFGCACLIPLVWHRRLDGAGWILYLAFFATNVAALYYLHAGEDLRAMHNTVVSGLWLIYLIVGTAYLGRTTGVTSYGRLLFGLRRPPSASATDDEPRNTGRADADAT